MTYSSPLRRSAADTASPDGEQSAQVGDLSRRPKNAAIDIDPEERIHGAKRKGDDGTLRPDHQPIGPVIPVPRNEQKECEDYLKGEPPKTESTRRSAKRQPGRLLPVLFLGGLMAAIVSALLVFALAAIAQVSVLPLWSQTVAYTAICVLIAAVVVPSVQLVFLYVRLPRVNQVVLDRTNKRLKQQAEGATAVAAATAAAKSLCDYVRCYCESEKEAEKIPCDEDWLSKLNEKRHDLQQRFDHGAAGLWIERFHDEFQQPLLDALARERVKRHARMAAVQAAISPNALVDALVVAYYSFKMIEDLCRIYNVRADRLGTIKLLVQTFFTAYVAGRLDDAEDFVSEQLDSFWNDAELRSAAGNALFGLVHQVFAKAAAKMATGFASYIMLRRLGAHGIRLLQPTRLA